MSRSGGRGNSRDRNRETFMDFYNKNDKYDWKAAEKAEEYLGVDSGGDNYKWQKSLSESELGDFKLYTGNFYTYINEALRNNDTTSDYYHVGKNVADALGRHSPNVNIVLHRGDSGKVFGIKGKSQDEMMKIMKGKIGEEFSFNNIISTSPSRPWSGAVQYHIRAPKGKTKGGYVDKFSKHSGEREFMLHPDTKFRIDKVEKTPNYRNGGMIELYLTII